MEKTVTDYFSRLTSSVVTPQTMLTLTSSQVGAAYSWLRRNNIAVNEDLLMGKSFTVNGLLSETPPAIIADRQDRFVTPSPSVVGEVGLDLEMVESMPACDDYWEHEFYRDNFTDREIAHCLASGDARQSFCGLWAAKEAAVKAGVAGERPPTLKHIEIHYDRHGKPLSTLGKVSISHTGPFCAAIFIAGGSAVTTTPLVRQQPVTEPETAKRGGLSRRATCGVVVTFTVVVNLVILALMKASGVI